MEEGEVGGGIEELAFYLGAFQLRRCSRGPAMRVWGLVMSLCWSMTGSPGDCVGLGEV